MQKKHITRQTFSYFNGFKKSKPWFIKAKKFEFKINEENS